MKEYHKIQTVFKRDMATKKKRIIENDWTTPEIRYLSKNMWVWTEKVDGTNIRIKYQDGKVSFAGKTDRAQIPAQLANNLNDIFVAQTAIFREKFDADVCLYGEGFGANIQNGGNYRPDQGFVLFDVKIGDFWLLREDVADIAKAFNIDIVPIVFAGSLYDAVEMVKRGFSSAWGGFQAEGIVARPEPELKDRNGHRIITKIKCRDFK